MAERLCPGVLDRETEFVIAYDPVTNTTARRFGTCGPCAAHAVLSNWLNKYVATADVYTTMRRRGLCDPSGASTISGLQSALQAYGAPIAAFRQWSDTNWSDWRASFDAHAGVDPFLFETQNGQALVDLISGCGENATNLQRHFVAVLGKHDGGYSARAGRDLPAGYWCADGDNFAGNNDNAHGFNAAHVLQFYSVDAVGASLPRALVAAKGNANMGIPTGWKDDGKTLTAPNGKTCTQGFRYAVIHAVPQWPSDNVPLEAVRYVDHVQASDPSKGFGAVQTFQRSRLYWLKANNTIGEVPAGAELLAVEARLNDANAQIAALNAKLAALEQQPPVDALAQEALAVARAEHALETKLQ